MPFPPLRQETLRTVVVVGDHGETAVALRDALTRSMVVVLDARPAEAAAAIAVCRPCPWALVWSSAADMPVALEVRPPTFVLVSAAHAAPAGVAPSTSFATLRSRLREMLAAEVGGMRLAPGVGVEMPGGVVSRSPWLQALVSAHPAGVPARAAQVRAARSLLRAQGAGWTVARGADGTMALVRMEAAA
ncbi:MAG: hypothetical protein JOZ75_01145 [Candidatus Dormibacteraeota bacterium]|nr:hypothetical protein [Candidatus Dormibacteraeota bacterium]